VSETILFSTHHLVVLCTSHCSARGNLMGARALRPLLLLSGRHETLFCRSDRRSQAIHRRHSDSCALDPKMVSEVGAILALLQR